MYIFSIFSLMILGNILFTWSQYSFLTQTRRVIKLFSSSTVFNMMQFLCTILFWETLYSNLNQVKWRLIYIILVDCILIYLMVILISYTDQFSGNFAYFIWTSRHLWSLIGSDTCIAVEQRVDLIPVGLECLFIQLMEGKALEVYFGL